MPRAAWREPLARLWRGTALAESRGDRAREIVRAEVHWYEASGIGRRELKIKRIL